MLEFIMCGLGVICLAVSGVYWTCERRKLEDALYNAKEDQRLAKIAEKNANERYKDVAEERRKLDIQYTQYTQDCQDEYDRRAAQLEIEYNDKQKLTERARCLYVRKADDLQQRINSYDNTTSSSS